MRKLKNHFFIEEREVGLASCPLLVAEIACAHHGDFERAQRLIDAATDAGADVVQLQIFRASHQLAPGHSMRSLLETIEFSDEEWASLCDRVKKNGKMLSVFVYDLPSLELALTLDPALLKLSSSDLSHERMLCACGKSKKPILLSTGGSRMSEVESALQVLEENGANEVVLMHGVQNFPTPLEDARIQRIQALSYFFDLPVGFQDHTDASTPEAADTDLLALGAGACVLEKHLTLSRAEKLTDYQAAMEPEEWKVYAARIRSVAPAMNDRNIVGLNEADLQYRQFQKKYAHAVRPLRKGEHLSEDALVYLRAESGTGLSEIEIKRFLDRPLHQNIPQGELLLEKHFDG